MNSHIRNINTEKRHSRKVSNKITFFSLALIAFGILALYGRIQHVDPKDALSMFFLITGSILLASGITLLFAHPRHITIDKAKIVSKVSIVDKVNWGQVKVALLVSVILGYVVFSQFVSNLVVFIK